MTVFFLLAALSASVLGEFQREERPEGLSGITRGDGTYLCVDDRGGRVFEYRLEFDAAGSVKGARVVRSHKLAGRVDLEGCAWDALSGWLWVSDEADGSIRAFALDADKERSSIALPKGVAGAFRRNRSIEGLCLSPDGLSLWAANEDTLEGDGALSSAKNGGVVRLMRFFRANARERFAFDRHFRYVTDPVAGEAFCGQAVSGVSALCALGDGSLLVLEREFSAKGPFEVSFRTRLYCVPPSSFAAGKVEKKLLWGDDTGMRNYEGMCLGPRLADGRETLILVSDGGGEAEECFLSLALTRR